ncbi:GTP cyclohydrolase I [Mycobacterium szulgai]|uniref:GTP cyclohydrolase I n=1 Tax=Mycobacterium szulgai TaxID=1787 RepID=UPI0021F38D5F|nr:GTP cyclohydrolase I [Mycobacterium szulgai]
MAPFGLGDWAISDDEMGPASDYPPHYGEPAATPMPWYDSNPDMAVEQAVRNLIDALGVDEGEHTAQTPARVARAWREMLWGYNEVPEDHLDTDFPAPDDPGLIVMHGISFASTCAHHLLPFSGTATIAYRPHPGQRIVGLSKLAAWCTVTRAAAGTGAHRTSGCRGNHAQAQPFWGDVCHHSAT